MDPLRIVDYTTGEITSELPPWTTRADALRDISELWNITVRAGWEFAHVLSHALTQFAHNDVEKWAFLGEVADQTGASIKTLQNMVSISRNQSAIAAEQHGLSIAHGDALTKLDPETALGYAATAAEQRWSVAELRMEIKNALAGETLEPPKAKVITLELDPDMLLDDLCGAVVNFVRQNWGAEGVSALGEWLVDN